MSYTKNYYRILGLDPPTPPQRSSSHTTTSPAALRRAYNLALLSAHPDKQAQARIPVQTQTQHDEQIQQIQAHTPPTIDDIQEAYRILSNVAEKQRYDNFLARNPWLLDSGSGSSSGAGRNGNANNKAAIDTSWLSGLESLDLSDFTLLHPEFDSSSSPSSDSLMTSLSNDVSRPLNAPLSPHLIWSRPCRCGDELGFRIWEQQLEEAGGRGEREVLVGCAGCSLWVRVGFDVEDE